VTFICGTDVRVHFNRQRHAVEFASAAEHVDWRGVLLAHRSAETVLTQPESRTDAAITVPMAQARVAVPTKITALL
jgi:hypothetical protein